MSLQKPDKQTVKTALFNAKGITLTIKTKIILIYLVILSLLFATLTTLNLLKIAEERVADAQMHQFQSNKLAHQLQQSSEDLTRMARTYVVTGDPIFEQYFFDILGIRGGTMPRPQDYDNIYWDFVIAGGEWSEATGTPAALLDMMKQSGMSDDELSMLEEAKKNSDDLTHLEKVAFGAMKGLFEDDLGNLTIKGEPDPAFAREILYNDKYFEAKANIMRPISEFITLVDERTRHKLEARQEQELFYLTAAVLLTITMFIFSLGSFYHVNRIEIFKRLKAEEKMRLITDNATDIISLRNTEGEIIYLSPSFTRHLGYDTEEYRNNNRYIDIIHPNERNDFTKKWNKKLFLEGVPFTYRLRLKTIKGDYLWFESQSRPIKDEDDVTVAAVTVSRNISKQRAMEDHLRQAKKMEAVGQLTGGVAHEFNNILTTILGSLRIFETLKMNKDTKECLEFTIEAAKKGANLTDQLLKFSRRETLEPETLNPNILFGGITPLLELAVGKDTRFRFQPASENMYINVDKQELENSLMALCTNAKEATQATGGLVKCQVNRATIKPDLNEQEAIPPGDYCQITVADTGHGMAPDIIEQALDPFFTTKPVGEGSGLGLSSVYGFVEQSQGYIQIDSESGLGSSVSMYFPLVKSEPEGKKQDKPGLKKPTKKTILFVEDEAKQILLSSKALEAIGGKILIAKTLKEAKNIIKKQDDITLLISKMTIEGNNIGETLAFHFNNKFKNGKIILVDTHPQIAQNTIDKSSLIGEVLITPYTLTNLIAKTDNILNTPIN